MELLSLLNELKQMICMEQLSGTCYTKGMRKKEISTFTTVMEKHMVKNRRSSRRYAG